MAGIPGHEGERRWETETMSDFAAAECGIRQLHARYTDAVWRKDPQSFAECFTADGEWRISGMALKGRAEIAETIERILANARRVLMTFRTPLIEVSGKTAFGRTYVTEQCSWTHREPNISIGRYYEHFVEEDGRWLFRWRLFQILYSGPEDLSGTYHDQPDFGPPPGMPPLDFVPADHAKAKWKLGEG
jgi:uncharacterized protein (TIGR02246 family)